jgi:predicted nucleic acid-binding protein
VYLVDTNVISEVHKGDRANRGVRRFFRDIIDTGQPAYLSAVTIGEFQRGIGLIRHRGDHAQAEQLEDWLTRVRGEYGDAIPPIDSDIVLIWRHLRTPPPEDALDKLMAATDLIYDLPMVTRNQPDFAATGARIWNPFM